jgi:SIR2-like domain
MSLKPENWDDLQKAITSSECTPFIGAGASAFKNKDGKPWLPLGGGIAKEWAEKYGYPLEHSCSQLDKVSLFIGIKRNNELFPKKELREMLSKISPPNFGDEEYDNTPHAVLADLDLPIYLTTNYDVFMEEALRSRGKKPNSEYCRWNPAIQEFGEESFLSDNKGYRPTKTEPLVYHLHGRLDTPHSMVLTERDYIEFVINLAQNRDLLPYRIRQALAMTSLLFIGYSMEDINFRVIFQSILGTIKPPFQLPNIAVQLPPIFPEPTRQKALEYMNDYTKNMFKVSIYWGDAIEFARELRKYLEQIPKI